MSAPAWPAAAVGEAAWAADLVDDVVRLSASAGRLLKFDGALTITGDVWRARIEPRDRPRWDDVMEALRSGRSRAARFSLGVLDETGRRRRLSMRVRAPTRPVASTRYCMGYLRLDGGPLPPPDDPPLSSPRDIDPLTGLAGRSALLARIELLIAQTGKTLADARGGGRRRSAARAALVLVDLDRFKAINRDLGHDGGDAALIAVARRLEGWVRSGDLVARIGDDEFAVLLAEVSNDAELQALARRVQASLGAALKIGARSATLSASLGAILIDDGVRDASGVFEAAATALAAAKGAGKGHFRVSGVGGPSDETARGAFEMEAALRRAIDRDLIDLRYQPIVRLADGAIAGFEALARWRTDDGGAAPDVFVPLAEETGLIVPLGRKALMTAAREAAAIAAARGDDAISIAVNVSPRQFQRNDIVADVAAALKASGAPPRCLKIEVTETMLLADPDRVLAAMAGLKALGVSLALDDFGAGWSSLAHVERYPFDVIKIDRAFTSRMSAHRPAALATRFIVELAHALDMTVVAEGVETEVAAAELSAIGCDLAQGFLYGAASDAATMRAVAGAAHVTLG